MGSNNSSTPISNTDSWSTQISLTWTIARKIFPLHRRRVATGSPTDRIGPCDNCESKLIEAESTVVGEAMVNRVNPAIRSSRFVDPECVEKMFCVILEACEA